MNVKKSKMNVINNVHPQILYVQINNEVADIGNFLVYFQVIKFPKEIVGSGKEAIDIASSNLP